VDVAFRKATDADAEAALAVVDRALREYGLWAVPEAGDIDVVTIERSYDARGGRLELIELGGEVVGVVGWRPAGADAFELKKLYLLAGARGHGIGRQAATRAIDAARAAGARAIVLETAARLTEANALYRRLGFVPVTGAAAGSFATLTDQCDLAYRLDL
jgi:putative acetyltransferase